MIAQDQKCVFAQVRHETWFLLFIQRQPFVVVISERSKHEECLLRNGQYPCFLSRNRYTVICVKMQYANRVFTCGVDCAVDRKSSRIDAEVGWHHHVAF